jgi:hypothetical protein
MESVIDLKLQFSTRKLIMLVRDYMLTIEYL